MIYRIKGTYEKVAKDKTMKIKKKGLALCILALLFLFIILFLAVPLAHRIYSTNVLTKYGKLQAGMGRNDVVRLLGRPLEIRTINSSDLEFDSSSWDFSQETLDSLKAMNIPLERYLYLIRLLPSLSRHMKPRIGVEVYIGEDDHRVVLIHRLH
jgi:hypothetical protein